MSLRKLLEGRVWGLVLAHHFFPNCGLLADGQSSINLSEWMLSKSPRPAINLGHSDPELVTETECCQPGHGSYGVGICPGLEGRTAFVFLTWLVLVHDRPQTSHTSRSSVPTEVRLSFQNPHHGHMRSGFISTPDSNPRTPCGHITSPRAIGHPKGHLTLSVYAAVWALTSPVCHPILRISLQPAGEDQQIRKSSLIEIVNLVKFK